MRSDGKKFCIGVNMVDETIEAYKLSFVTTI